MPFDLQPILTGRFITARPLRADDFEALYKAASDRRIWEQHPEADRYTPEVFARFFDGAMASGGAFLVLDAASGQVIGSSRYFGLDEVRSEIEIGWTFLARSHWGGRYNGELKQLMLAHAFQFVDSVVFFIGPGNLRSQQAILRVGGVRAPERDQPDRLCYRIRRSG